MGVFDLFKKNLKVDKKPTRLFDNLPVDNYLGLIINESTTAQIKEVLNSEGLSYKEFPVYGHKDEIDVAFQHRIGDIDWSCRLTTRNGVLKGAVLNIYSPNSYTIYQSLCKELEERCSTSHDISKRRDSHDGTETTCFTNKDDTWQFTEVEYDSSPILGQKNVYIRYFK